MEFSAVEWDEAKGRTNLGKHKIDFTDAAGVFGDPDQLTFRSEYRPPRPRASHAGTNGNVMKKNKSSERNRDEDVVTLVASLPDETSVLEHADGRPERSKSQTDWAALDALTDEEIEAAIKNDPDWSDDWNWGEAVLVIPPKKQAISIRVDQDVLDYFKSEGAGYQRRMNAVLRSYMQHKTKKKRA